MRPPGNTEKINKLTPQLPLGQHFPVAAFSQPPKGGLGTVKVQFGADQGPQNGKRSDIMKNLIASALVAGGLIGLSVSSANAATLFSQTGTLISAVASDSDTPNYRAE